MCWLANLQFPLFPSHCLIFLLLFQSQTESCSVVVPRAQLDLPWVTLSVYCIHHQLLLFIKWLNFWGFSLIAHRFRHLCKCASNGCLRAWILIYEACTSWSHSELCQRIKSVCHSAYRLWQKPVYTCFLAVFNKKERGYSIVVVVTPLLVILKDRVSKKPG